MVVLANVVASLSNLETQSRVASGKAVKAADAAAEEYSENADEKASLARTAVSVLDSVVFCHRAVTAAMLDVNTDLAALVTGAEECFHLAGSSDAVAATRSVRATVVRLSPHLLALATASDAVVTAVDVLDQTADLTAAARTKRITPCMMHAYRLMSRTANGRSGTRLHRASSIKTTLPEALFKIAQTLLRAS